MWGSMWMWTYPRSSASRPSAPELVLSRLLRTPFSAELAEQLLSELPKRQLLRLWDDSTRLLALQLRAEVRLNVVILRDQLLGRLESDDPRALEACLET